MEERGKTWGRVIELPGGAGTKVVAVGVWRALIWSSNLSCRLRRLH